MSKATRDTKKTFYRIADFTNFEKQYIIRGEIDALALWLEVQKHRMTIDNVVEFKRELEAMWNFINVPGDGAMKSMLLNLVLAPILKKKSKK